ncbi:hypothetical protein [Actinomadura sp. CNU-125]|uniref:hypothetical protein n=1 Tax=Actinomadura sp. CNU-125 TaxID=1904961 RepID=UPI00130103C6|nr:hypothetical protein [Actinomadura sp. CNU-125]
MTAAAATGDLGLGFADSSWIRLHGTPSAESKARAEAVRACFPHVPGPWPGDKPPKK